MREGENRMDLRVFGFLVWAFEWTLALFVEMVLEEEWVSEILFVGKKNDFLFYVILNIEVIGCI